MRVAPEIGVLAWIVDDTGVKKDGTPSPGVKRQWSGTLGKIDNCQVAVSVHAVVELAVLCWHMITKGEDYAFARPSLTAMKLRALELKAGLPSRRGQKGSAAVYSLKEVRARERQIAEQAERAYAQLVADWQAKAPKKGVAAANGARRAKPSTGQLRGRTQPQILRFAPGSTTPTPQANAGSNRCRCPDPLE